MLNLFLILFGKSISLISKSFNLGNGSTWPGHIALKVNKNFIKEILQGSQAKIVLVAGTNGKTTTAKMITTILQENNKRVFQNTSGANLVNGIASTLMLNTNIFGKLSKEYGVFEIDENSLPLILKELTPYAIILLNLFRDQLDRYGEIDSIAKKWKAALESLPQETKIILNADDPQIAYLAHSIQGRTLEKVRPYHIFGLNEKTTNKTLQHAADSIYCPNCHTRLTYSKVYYSHLGIWQCSHCKLKRPTPDITTFFYPLSGTYNKYNTLAAVLFAKLENIDDKKIEKALKTIKPAFGRQEIIEIEDKKAQIFLAKNPTSFNQSLETIKNLGAKTVLFVLNDQIPDGRDVSWIWDIDIEEYADGFNHIIVSGDRVYDMGLRVRYVENIKNKKLNSKNTNEKLKMFESLNEGIKQSLHLLKANETLYILPTYSAMLEVRKVLTGKKIL